MLAVKDPVWSFYSSQGPLRGLFEGCHLEASAEHDALGQWEFLRVVDGGSLAAHVGLPGIAATFASAAGFLLAAKGTADLGATGADVHVGDAAIAAAGGEELFGFSQVVGEDGRAEALGHFVVVGDGLIQGAVPNQVKDRGEGRSEEHTSELQSLRHLVC